MANHSFSVVFLLLIIIDWLEEENLAVSSGTINPDLGGLMQSYDDISDGDEF